MCRHLNENIVLGRVEKLRRDSNVSRRFLTRSNSKSISLNEAHILQSKYDIDGFKFVLKDRATKLPDYNPGDIFTVELDPDDVDSAEKIISRGYKIQQGQEEDEYNRYLRGPDNRLFNFIGGSKSFDGYFKRGTGQMPTATDWEYLITFAYNGGDVNANPELAQKVEEWIGSTYYEKAFQIADDIRSKGIATTPNLENIGSDSAPITQEWQSWGGKDKTPKTDILGGNSHISLKKSGGSQITSGLVSETTALFEATKKRMGESFPTEIQNFIDSLPDKMPKLDIGVNITTAKKLAQLNPDDLKKQADKNTIEHIQKSNETMTKELDSFLKENPVFKQCFVYEAITGDSKFVDLEPKANVLVKFDADEGNILGYKEVNSIEDVRDIAEGVNFQFSFKTSGTTPAVSMRGYTTESKHNHTSTLREIVVDEYRKLDEKMQMIVETTIKEKNTRLDEFSIMDTLKKIKSKLPAGAQKYADKIVNFFKGVWDRILNAFESIKKLGGKMIDGLLDFFGIGVEIKSVSGGGDGFDIQELIAG